MYRIHDLVLPVEASLEVICKTSVLKNFAKRTRKPLCQSLFLTKLQT